MSDPNSAFLDYYRCPETFADFKPLAKDFTDAGFFRFGSENICFGPSSSGFWSKSASDPLHDTLQDVRFERAACLLPFNPTTVVENLRRERYVLPPSSSEKHGRWARWVRRAYYTARPPLPVSVRKFLQRASLRGWDKTAFPQWPVDRTVDQIFETLLILTMKAKGVDRLPFIWFWPDGNSSCAIMTHDVETAAGLKFCPAMMDLEDSCGIKSSFQIIPEKRYCVSESELSQFRNRGFEINVHDLNHDGHLFSDRREFLGRAEKINRYAREYGARGFRSGALYRNLDWYDALDFSYDMSVPNVAQLDPQRGGCCTVFPYFIGKILELPLTTTQDYSLFHILNDYSIDLWKRQIELVQEKHGLISFIVHPDYIISQRARNTYLALLEHLSRVRADGKTWFALPAEVDAWWRARARMELVCEDSNWVVRGRGSERARVGFASLEGERVRYTVAPAQEPVQGNPASECR